MSWKQRNEHRNHPVDLIHGPNEIHSTPPYRLCLYNENRVRAGWNEKCYHWLWYIFKSVIRPHSLYLATRAVRGVAGLCGSLAIITASVSRYAAEDDLSLLACQTTRPEQLVVRDAVAGHHVERALNAAGRLGGVWLIVWLVVDEASRNTVAELLILPGIQDERVPSDVHERWGWKRPVRVVCTDHEEAKRWLHDFLCKRTLDAFIGNNSADKTFERLRRDKVSERNCQVWQLCYRCRQHGVPPVDSYGPSVRS